MRKQKVIKMTASPLDPSLGGSFQPPATHNGDISIVFRGKDMSIHGWDGSAWSTIYTRNGDDKQFAFPHTYQNYYVKSLTGSDETFSASFFSTGKYERSTPLLAGVQRDTKLHDIEEVPIYTASDVNKLLTIMSDGSLRWLGISESYVVEVIGTGGGSQTPSPTLLSQSVPFGDASYDASTDVMTFDGTGDYATFGGDYAFTDAITVAAWFKTTAGGDRRIMSSHVRQSTQFTNGWIMMLNNGQLQYRHPSGGSGLLNGPTGLNNGEWQHVAMTWTPSGYALYVNGSQHASGGASVADGYDMTFDLHIGANSWNGNSPYAFFDGQIGGAIVENEAMTLEQVQAIYNNGPEYVASTEAPAEENPQVIAGTFLEELQSAADNAQQNAEIVDGVFFRTKAFNSNGTVNHDNTKLSMTAVDLEADGIISYTNNVADTGDKNHVEFSLSFWVKPVGSVAGQVMFTGLGGGFNVRTDGTNDITVYYPRGGGLVGLGKAVVSNDTWTIDGWEHICLVVKEREDDPTKWAMYIYKGGQPLNGGNWIASTDSKLIPDSNINSMFGLGGQASTQSGSVVYNGMDGSFYLDSFQIAQGVVLTDEQVAAIAAQTDRQMSIETAALPAETPQITGTFIEDLEGFTGTAVNGIWTDSGSQQGQYASIGLSTDNVIGYVGGEPTEDEFTISWWMNLDSSQAASNLTVAGRHLGTINGVNRNFKINLGNVNAGVTNPHFQVYLGATTMSNLSTGVPMGNTWTHCAVVCKSDGSQLVISAYLNGNKLPGTSTKPLGTKLLPPESHENFYWGGNGQSGSSVKGQFDSMQIKDGVALTDEQVAAIAAQSDRQMYIEEAAAL